jgi:hypothetical protein
MAAAACSPPQDLAQQPARQTSHSPLLLLLPPLRLLLWVTEVPCLTG